jgi:purine-nucleoside phosphorylase
MTTIKYNETVDYLRKKIPFTPLCAIILGTGLGALADHIEDKIEIPYEDIPGFVKSTAPSHHGAMIAGFVSSADQTSGSDSRVPVIVFKGRFHFYEGY